MLSLGFWQVPTQVALQQGPYKLIRYRADPAWTELFALDQDPLEMRNLAPLPEAAALLAGMSASLEAELARFAYVIPSYADPEPRVAPAP